MTQSAIREIYPNEIAMRPISEFEAGGLLPAARANADAAYRAARRRDGVNVNVLDHRWTAVSAAIAGQPASTRVRVLTSFTAWAEKQVADLDRAEREAAASAAATAAERHAHALDGVAMATYVAAADFLRMIDGVTFNIRKGWLTDDRNLVAKLLASGAPVEPIDPDDIVTCRCGCRFQISRNRAGPR
jgi:hypothetical protein